jgi:hypothetical protein
MSQAINLNDAIFKMCNPQATYYDRYSLTDFNKTNCPLLHEFADGNFKKVPTFLDWVKMLGGNPSVNALDSRSCGRIRAGSYDGYLSQNKGYWGYTFGTPKGPRGKPLAASKPLDDTWFFYDKPGTDTGRWSLTYGNDSTYTYGAYSLGTSSLGDCIVRQYHANGWQNYYFNPHYTTASNFNNRNWITLDEGAYLIGAFPYYDGGSHYHRCGWEVLINDTIVLFCAGGLTSGAWGANNSIFFVDTEMKIRPYWWSGGGNGYMMFMLFRITPPNSWY